MATLLLGPLLRYVDESRATVWVEVDEPCEVSVLHAATPTFCVEGHHYALVVIEDLEPGSTHPYEVHLDGERVWPPADHALPPSVIRTRGADPGGRLRLLFGSCRTAAPHEPPYSLEARDHQARGVDALRAHGLRMASQPVSEWPDLLVLLGDQVYADDASPGVRRRLAERNPPEGLPADDVANFEEYTWLYHESWTPEVERWMLSTVPSTMIFDDHDMIDDWNISLRWVEATRRQPWWEDHIIGGLMSYWVYQHLGNLSPDAIRAEGLLERAMAAGDAGELLHRWAAGAEEFTAGRPDGYRFSFSRNLGAVHLVVIDSRNGRVLDPGGRSMVDDEEWDWIVQQCHRPARDLLIATSLAVFVPPGLHDLQAWNEQLCDGRWGRLAARVGERMRRALDLEDWASFQRSFTALGHLLAEVGAGDQPPRTISILSGDIHFSYRAAITFPEGSGVRSRVNQVVSSPIRNALAGVDRTVLRFASSRLGRAVGRGLVRTVRAGGTELTWKVCQGPFFGNEMSQLELDGRGVRLIVEHASPDEAGQPVLTVSATAEL
jgi:hypothetical protein